MKTSVNEVNEIWTQMREEGHSDEEIEYALLCQFIVNGLQNYNVDFSIDGKKLCGNGLAALLSKIYYDNALACDTVH